MALLNVQEQHNLLQSALYGFGAAAGFGLVLVMFAAMRERIAYADVPLHFRGAPIGFAGEANVRWMRENPVWDAQKLLHSNQESHVSRKEVLK